MNFFIIILLFGLLVLNRLIRFWLFEPRRRRRQEYYQNVYLKSEEWQRKRFVVLRRDQWKCVFCGAPATEVHHKRYAKRKIGKEPISWLISVCKPCHLKQHGQRVDAKLNNI